MKIFTPRVVAAILLSASLAACAQQQNEGGQEPGRPTQASFPVTIRADNGKVEIPQRPTRIVSLSPSATEMLFAIGADDQVIAVDDNSNYPPEAPMTKLSGFEPNVEAIAKFEPDLVVASNDPGSLEKSVAALDIPFILQTAATTLADTYSQIEQLGAGTGHISEAAEEVARMQAEIDEIVASLPELEGTPTYYHELDQTYFSATSDTFIGEVYGLMGLRNIADNAKGAGSGYPQLSAEYIIDADPDLIFLADTKCCNQSAETVAKRPGWNQITAVQTDSVVELDDDIASRWGPRVVDFLQVVARAVSQLETVES